jgi:hypothetical protein
VRTVNQRTLARAEVKEALADEPRRQDETPEMERTQRIDLAALSPERTQRIDPTITQPFHPERTQRLQAEPAPPANPADEPTRTQRLDASIQKLQEAKRLLKGVAEKP